LNESEDSGGESESHSFFTAFFELFKELSEDFPDDKCVGILDLEYDFGDLNLFLFEDWICDILIIGLFFEYGVDEDEEFLDDGLIVELDAAFDDGFGDLFGDFSAFFEAEVLEEGGVLFHGEDEIAEGVEWVDEELADVNLAVFVNRRLILGTVVGGILQDFIDILVLGGVAFEGELQEGAVQIKRVLDFARV
jgi:hypothetical protein